MTGRPKPVKLTSTLIASDSTPVYHFLRFPKESVRHFEFKGNLRRVICTLNGTERFNCALFPSKESYLISLSKARRDKLGIRVGDSVAVELERDETKYGFPMPREFAEVLRQDEEGKALFEELTPGNQRIMLQLVNYVKNVDKRIVRSLVGIELLKKNDGKFDYHMQHDGMRVACQAPQDLKFDI